MLSDFRAGDAELPAAALERLIDTLLGIDQVCATNATIQPAAARNRCYQDPPLGCNRLFGRLPGPSLRWLVQTQPFCRIRAAQTTLRLGNALPCSFATAADESGLLPGKSSWTFNSNARASSVKSGQGRIKPLLHVL